MLSFFGFKPSCPLTLEEQVWIERRMCWLRNRLGNDRLQASVPGNFTAQDFPELSQLNRETVKPLFERLRELFKVSHSVRLEVDAPTRGADGPVVALAVEPGRVIRLQEQALADPSRTMAIVTRELAREFLQAENFITGEEADLEPLLDLATVCYGFGIFGANANHQSKPDKGAGAYSWIMTRVRSLNSFQFGYALAVYCWLRKETPGVWQQELRRDSRDSLLQGMKYLNKSETAQIFEVRPTDETVYPIWERRLKSGPDSLILDTLWEMTMVKQALPESLVPSILRHVNHSEASIGKGALDVFMASPHLAVKAERDLVDCLHHSAVKIRYAALGALSKISRSRDTQDALVHLLGKERDHNTRMRIVGMMVNQPAAAAPEEVVPVLLETMRESLLESNEGEITLLAQLMDRISDDADAEIRSRFGHSEEDEWMELALTCLAESRKPVQ